MVKSSFDLAKACAVPSPTMDADKLDVRALLERYDAAVGYADTAAAVKPLHAAAPQLAREHIAQAEMIAKMREALGGIEGRIETAASWINDATEWDNREGPCDNETVIDFILAGARAALALPDPVDHK